MLKLKDNIPEAVKEKASSDFWYDLFEGGYINPYDYLEKESADRVNEALKTVKEFQDILEENELIGEM